VPPTRCSSGIGEEGDLARTGLQSRWVGAERGFARCAHAGCGGGLDLLLLLLGEGVALACDTLDGTRHTADCGCRGCGWDGGGRADASGGGAARFFGYAGGALVHGLVGDEGVVDSFGGFEAAVGIPAQTACDEIDERFIVRLERLL